MLTFVIYTQALIVTILYCIAALPFFLLLMLIFGGFRKPRQKIMRMFIAWYGKSIIFISWKPFVRVFYEDRSSSFSGKGIYIFNHRSSSDPFLVAAIANQPLVQVVNHWPMKLPFFGFFASLAGYLDITTVNYEKALEWAKKRIFDEDTSIVVFPEGTRSGNRNINQFHGTFFRIAKALDCPLIPVAVSGNENCPDRNFKMSRGKIRIRKLAPIPLDVIRKTPPFQLKNMVRDILIRETGLMDEAE